MKQLSEITEHLLRFSPDALIVVDDRGTICFANETIRELFGHEPAALLGQSVDTLIPSRLRGRHGQLTAGYMHAPTNREMGARIADLFAMRSDGSEFAAGIRLAPFRIGDRLFVAAAIRDVSERRRVNEELVIAREEADRANRAKSRFLATASHDLRQPMQTIRLLNASLLKTVPDAATRELLEQQEVAIESMTRLLNALLDISRLESGAIEPVKSDVRLEQIFEELRSELSSVARTRGIALKIEPSAWVLSTDRTLVSQLLQNLLGNALKYTDSGFVSLSCQMDAEALTIAIRDTGIGIPADKLERIFDEYYQVDTHGTKRMGVGLGLAIVKEVARLLGFSVRITSKVGEGTKVAVRVPRQCVSADLHGAAVGVSDQQATAANVKPRLFLVEDNDGVRVATALFLKLEGFETFSAGSVVEAEALFGSLKPGDILIADFHLDPKNTGLDMLMRLRERVGYDVPAVILSGDLPSMLRSLKTEVPDCQFLGKPVDTGALLNAIAQCSSSSKELIGGG
jgi:two-component system, sensor histidine kinase